MGSLGIYSLVSVWMGLFRFHVSLSVLCLCKLKNSKQNLDNTIKGHLTGIVFERVQVRNWEIVVYTSDLLTGAPVIELSSAVSGIDNHDTGILARAL